MPNPVHIAEDDALLAGPGELTPPENEEPLPQPAAEPAPVVKASPAMTLRTESNPFDEFDAPPTSREVPLPSPSDVHITYDKNPFDEFDVPAPWNPEKPSENVQVGALQSGVNSADRAIVGSVGQALAYGGKILSAFDDSVDPNNDADNPYMQAGHDLQNYAQRYTTNPKHPVANKIGEVGGGLLPILASGPAAPLTAGVTSAGSIYQNVEGRGGDTGDAILAATGGGLIVGGATVGLGPLGGKLFGEIPTLASSTWGQLGTNLVWNGLRSSSRTFWDMLGQNVATGEITNAALPAGAKDSQYDILSNSLTDALTMAPVGAITHGLGQVTAEYNVSRVASKAGQMRTPEAIDAGLASINEQRAKDLKDNLEAINASDKPDNEKEYARNQAIQFHQPISRDDYVKSLTAQGRDKAGFITDTANYFDSLANDKTLTPQEKLSASTRFLSQFSPGAQAVITDHVQNVRNAIVSIRAAAADAQRLAPIAPQTAKAGYEADVNLVMRQMQDKAKAIETDADANEQALLESLRQPEPQPEQPPAENVTTEPEPSVQPADHPAAPEAAPALEQPPADKESIAPGEGAPPVAAEREGEGQPVAPPGNPFDEFDPKPAAPETQAKEPDLSSLSRADLLDIAQNEGVSERSAKGATTRVLPEIIRAHRLGQEPIDRANDLIDDGAGAKVDPRIDQLPDRQKAAVQSFVKAAKEWGFRGLNKFIIDTRAPSSAFTRPRDQHFDAVYINPNDLAHDLRLLGQRGVNEEGLHKIYQKIFSEEFGHLQSGKVLELEWKKAGSNGTFADYYDTRMREIYDAMTPAARRETAQRYGADLHDIDPNIKADQYENPYLPSRLAEEYVRRVWQLRGSQSDTESLISDRAKKVELSKQTERLIKSAQSNKPLVRLIQSTVARLKGLAAQLVGKGTPDHNIEDLVSRMENLTRAAEKPARTKKGKPQESRVFNRADPMLVAGSARPHEDIDFFADETHEPEATVATAEPAARPVPTELPPVDPNDLLRPNVDRPREGGSERSYADAREQRLTETIAQLAHVDVPVEEQERMRRLVGTLAHLQFGASAKARDVAEGNAFVKVMIQAKKWIEKNGSIDAENEQGQGFGARAIIINALLDEGRLEARQKRMFSGRTGEADEPEVKKEPGVEEEIPEAAPATAKPAFDPSETDHEANQAAFEPVGGGADHEGVSFDTPRKRAQDAIVNRNLAKVRDLLTPYGKRLMELWNDSPEDPNAKNPVWASRAAREYGLTKEQVMGDFAEIVSGLRDAVSRSGLTRDDFMRIAAAPRADEEGESSRQNDSERYSSPDDAQRNQDGIRRGDQVLGRGPEKEDVRAVPGAVPKEQQQSPSGYLERFLEHAGQHGLDLDSPDALFKYAAAHNEIVPKAELTALSKFAGKGGVEHEVFLAPDKDGAVQRVIKVTRPPSGRLGQLGYGMSPDAISYLTRLDKMNRLAPDLDYRVLGVTPKLARTKAWPSLVTSMRFIDGKEPTAAALKNYLVNKLGFKDEGLNNYSHPSGIKFGDVHTGNFIETPDGRMVPIDVTVEGEPAMPLDELRPASLPARTPPRISPHAPVEPGKELETFADRVAHDERVDRHIRDAVYGREYTPIPNDFTMREAETALAQDGLDKTYDRVLEPDTRQSGLDARQRVALGQLLIPKLEASGKPEDLNRATKIVETLSTYGKDLGQAVQAFSLWSRLGPAGIGAYYGKILKPSIDEARKPHEKVIGDIKDALETTRQGAVDGTLARPRIGEIIDEAEASSAKRARREARDTKKPIWQRYQEATAEALAEVARGPRDPKAKGALEAFAGRLTENLKSLLNENVEKRPGAAIEKLPAEARLAEVYQNEPQYREAWDTARQWIEEKFKDDPATLELFGDSLNRAFEAPVKLHDETLKQSIKGAGISLRDLVREWAGKQQATRDQLISAIKERMNLPEAQAEQLGTVLSKRFDLMLEEARKKELARVVKASGQKRLANQPQTVVKKILEAVNLGLTDDQAAYDAIADLYKLPKYDPKIVSDLQTRAREIQQMIADGKEGFQTDRKTQQMLNVLENVKEAQASRWKQAGNGLMALYYGNILGPTTVIRKTISEVGNAVAEVGTMSAAEMRRDPAALPRAVWAFGRGLVDRGMADAIETIAHGEGLRRGEKAWQQASRSFERGKPFGDVPVLKLLNKPTSVIYRYVGRSLEAGMAFFYAGHNEARANMLAYRLAKEEQRAGGTPTEWKINQRVAEILHNTPEMREKFYAQAEAEGLEGRQAKLRVAELMEQSRPEDLQRQARDFATRATFNQDPEGFLGALTRAILPLTNKYAPLKILMPFVRIPANVLNETIDYTPVGYLRAYRWDSLKKSQDADRHYQQLVKATVGSAATAALAAVFSQYADDNDPFLMVTADGPADYNKKKQLMEQGWAPYTIKWGGEYHGYREWPIAFGLAMVGHMLDAHRYKNVAGNSAGQRLAFTLLSSANEFTSRSWVANTADFLDIIRNNNPDRAGQAMEGFVGRTAGAFVPFNQSAVRILDKMWDPTQYTSKTLTGMLASQVVLARRMNEPALNALGEVVQTRPFAAFLAHQTEDPVWQGLANKGVWIPNMPASEWLGDRQMTEDEHYRYVQESGQKLREALQNGGLDKMADMDEEQAQEYLNTLTRESRAPVKAALRQEGIDNGTILTVGPKTKKGHQ